ncbi:MAG: CAP domain-containing protein [Actinobacteria bacterium]|nr:CAP domain-containing protein [Actinomycetota bacterium]
MRQWMGSKTGQSMLRYLWVVAAILAVLIAGVVGGKSASATSYDSEELQFLGLINQYREDNGLRPLLLSDTLSVASERHSQDMARYRFFAHITAASSYYPAGSQPWDRMRAEGYDYNTYMGENIAVGYEGAEGAFAAWRRSPSHNAAMLEGSYRVIGVARVNLPGSRWYWTTDFGTIVDPTAHAPGESEETNEAPEPQQQQEKRLVADGAGIENGEMNGEAVWEQEATDGAQLILDGHARLGDYDNGKDEIRQEIRVGESTELAYRIRIETTERRHPSDRLLVRLTDEEGKQLAVLERYTDANAGGWRRDTVDLSAFAGRTVYLSFFVETDPLLTTAFYLDGVSLDTRERF